MSESKADLASLLSMINSNDLNETIDQLGFMLGNPEKGEEVKSKLSTIFSQKMSEQNSSLQRMNHTDPVANLLLALKPFLSESRKNKVDKYMRAVNMSSFIRQIGEIQAELDRNEKSKP
ncbi:MAG: hypothetical protein SCK28_08050 [Bacillota bacterium]|nr:hypothetical protein [Bacillota bacterium]